MEKDPTHKWAIVAIAVILFLCTSAVSAFSKQTSMYFIVWLMVGWYGYKGNLEAIRTTIKFSIYANLGLMAFIYLFIGNNEYDSVRNLKNLMAIGLAIMLVPSAILYIYSNQEINEEKTSTNTESKTETEIKIENDVSVEKKIEINLDENTKNEIYSQVFEEVENNVREKGLWARCFADANGDENKTKALYIKIKAEKIIEEKENNNKNAQIEELKINKKNQIYFF